MCKWRMVRLGQTRPRHWTTSIVASRPGGRISRAREGGGSPGENPEVGKDGQRSLSKRSRLHESHMPPGLPLSPTPSPSRLFFFTRAVLLHAMAPRGHEGKDEEGRPLPSLARDPVALQPANLAVPDGPSPSALLKLTPWQEPGEVVGAEEPPAGRVVRT